MNYGHVVPSVIFLSNCISQILTRKHVEKYVTVLWSFIEIERVKTRPSSWKCPVMLHDSCIKLGSPNCTESGRYVKLYEPESSGWNSKLDGPKRKYGTVFSTSGYLNWYFRMQLVGIQVFYESIYLNYLFIWINFINNISFLIIINWINISTYVNIQFSAIFSVLRVLFLLVLRCSYVD